MKCPFRKETHTIGDWTYENFGECYKEECPFYGKKEYKKRYEGGYYELTGPGCRRVCEASEDKK